MNRHSFRLLFLSCVLASGCAAAPAKPANILLGPYVTAVSESSARVLWVTEPNAGPGELSAFTHPPGNQVKSVPVKAEVSSQPLPGRPEVLHSAALSGLKAGDRVSYAIKDSQGTTAGFFQTPPPAGFQAPFRFLVYGDTRSYPERHRAVAEAARKDGPYVFNLNTGDLVSNGEAWRLWKKEFFDPARELLASATFWPVRGNHENDAVMYSGLFPGLPNGGLYYSFDCGNVHVVVLDSGDKNDAPPSPEALAWLEKDLAASGAQWKLAVYHKPSVDTVLMGKTWGRRDLWPLFEKYGVDMIFSGHSHVYERFRPIGAPGAKPVIQIVTGGGGAPTYECKPSPALEVGYDGMNYCILDVAGPRLQLTAKSPDGNVIDRLTITKDARGMYDQATMARAMTTPEAWEIAYLLTGFWADFDEKPVAGKPVMMTIPAMFFAEGSTVEISPLADNPWGVQPTKWLVGNEPRQFRVVPPANLEFTRANGLRPAIRVKLTVTYLGKTYVREDCHIGTGPATVRMLTP